MAIENRPYYGVLLNDGTELSHYGVKGMKWGKHLFGLNPIGARSMGPMAETDTGTRAVKPVLDRSSIYKSVKEQAARRRAESAAKSQAALEKRRAYAEAAAAESKKKSSKKSSGSTKKSETKEEKKEAKKPEAKTPDLPKDLVDKLQDNNYQMTPDEIKTRSENGTAKAKELLATLPENPTEEEIFDLMKFESDKKGVGYDAFAIGIAIDTALIKYYDNSAKSLESKKGDADKIEDFKRKKALHEKMLKEALSTGRASY